MVLRGRALAVVELVGPAAVLVAAVPSRVGAAAVAELVVVQPVVVPVLRVAVIVGAALVLVAAVAELVVVQQVGLEAVPRVTLRGEPLSVPRRMLLPLLYLV